MIYRDVKIYAYMEHMQYHHLDDNGNITDEIAEPDHDPQLKGWEIYSDTGDAVFGGEIVDVEKYGKIEDVKKLIDDRIERWEQISNRKWGAE